MAGGELGRRSYGQRASSGHPDLELMGELRYMCKDPKQIKFAPLNRETEHTAEELMTIYEVSYLCTVL